MRIPKAWPAAAATVACTVALLFTDGAPAGALPPPPPNPSDAEVSGAASLKQQAEASVASASAAVTEMNGQIEALNAQAFAAATDYEVAQGQVEIAKQNQQQTQLDLTTAANNVGTAEASVMKLAREVYMQGGFTVSDAMLISADGPQDLIDRSNMLDIISEAQYKTLDNLRVAKVQQANADSAAKKAVEETSAAEAAAKVKLDEMNAKVASAEQAMAGLQAQKAQLDNQLAAAQNYLFALEGQKQSYQQWLAQKQAEEAAAAQAAAAAAAQQAAAAQAYAQQQAAAAAAAAAQQQSSSSSSSSGGGGSSSGGSAPAASSGGGGGSSSAAQSNGSWAKPAGGTLTSCFCTRWGTFHQGIDIANATYTPIYAAGNGTVVRAGSASGFGQAIYIQHAGGWVTVYGHIETIDVSAGQTVYAGQKIAGMGSRGQSTGPHLHFEVTQGMYGSRVNPIPWLADRGIYL